MSTSQVRERLPAQLARYEPDLVILWAGVNNYWNLAGAEREDGFGSRLGAFALRSRLYRLVRVAIHDASLESAAAETRADGRHQQSEIEKCRGDDCEFQARHRVRHDGVVDVVINRRAEGRDLAGLRQRTETDVAAMHRLLVAAGIGFAAVRYALDFHPFDAANAGIEDAARALGIPVADGAVALQRVPEASVEWLHGLHPNAALYHEIARELVPIAEAFDPEPP